MIFSSDIEDDMQREWVWKREKGERENTGIENVLKEIIIENTGNWFNKLERTPKQVERGWSWFAKEAR